MSWIKDNKFVVALGGGTLVGSILIFLVGMNGMERYDNAKEDFDKAAEQAAKYESDELYPEANNYNSKNDALEKYRSEHVAPVQAAFKAFRPKEGKPLTPGDFASELTAVDKKIREVCKEKGTKLPDNFFCGFEGTKLVSIDATGILQYELDGVKALVTAMADSHVTELKNLYRPRLIEEESTDAKATKATKATKDVDAVRPLPLEITFSGPEKSVRTFVEAIMHQQDKFFGIRSMRMSNAKREAPRTSDAKFDKPAAAAADGFSGPFTLPDPEPKPDDKKPPQGGAVPAPAAPVPVAPVPVAPAARSATDSSRILWQVLGSEEVEVFLRLDLMRFQPAKNLP